LIKARDINVSLARKSVLRAVSFDLSEGDFLAILGPNGGGKSTLIRVLLGLQEYEGDLTIAAGMDNVGYVPQIKTLDRSFPARAEELVATALKRRWPWSIDADCRSIVRNALKQVGVDHLASEQIRNLSGGELQRVYLARAIISRPSLLILDEPSAGVDVVGAANLLDHIEAYRKESGATVIMVTHDWEVALHHATHVMILKAEQISFGPSRDAMNEQAIRKAFGHVGHSHDVFAGGHDHAH